MKHLVLIPFCLQKIVSLEYLESSGQKKKKINMLNLPNALKMEWDKARILIYKYSSNPSLFMLLC